MAPAPEPRDSLFLAPLGKCLAGNHRLISWELAHQELSNPELARSSSNLEHFLGDSDCINLLSRPFSLYTSRRASARSEFDQYVNSLETSKDDQYDVNQLKEDALWLSEQAKVDEITSLRIIILEWQARPATRILQGYTTEEEISLQNAINSSNLGASTVGKVVDVNGANTRTLFDSQDKRRLRILNLFLSERRNLLDVATLITASGMTAPAEPEGRSYGTGKEKDIPGIPWLTTLGARIEDTRNGLRQSQGDQIVNIAIAEEAVAAIETRLRDLESGSGWNVQDEDSSQFQQRFRTNQLAEVVSLLRILLFKISPVAAPLPAIDVKAWFEFADRYGFFERLQLPSPDLQSYVGTIQALVCLISLQMLKLPYTLDYFDFPAIRGQSLPAPVDIACQKVVNEVLANAANHASSIASPALLAWSIILQRLREVTQNALGEGISDDESFLDDTPTKPRRRRRSSQNALSSTFADAIESVMDVSVEDDPIQFFAKAAVDPGNVFSVVSQLSQMLHMVVGSAWPTRPELHIRVGLLEWIRQALLITNYGSEVVDATLSVLEVEDNTRASMKSASMSTKNALIQLFVRDDAIFIPNLLHQAQSRYPYETTPFLKLCKALCPERATGDSNLEALPLSEATSRFTQIMPRGFDGFELVREDEEANCIRLTRDLPLFADRAAIKGTISALAETRQLQKSQVDREAFIPRGTIGYVINDTAPYVVMWEHQHSVLRYLGFLLSTVPASSMRKNLLSIEGGVDKGTQADIIDLLSALLDATVNIDTEEGSADQGNARWILEQASDALDRNEDIIAVVADIFEDELGSQAQGRDEGSTELLCACIHFLHAVVKVMPSRVWPLLARSEFLSIGGRSGRMSTLLESSELAPGRLTLLKQCVGLYDALVTDIMQHAIERKIPATRTGRRFSQVADAGSGSPQKVLSKILISLTHSFVNIVLTSANENASYALTFTSLYEQVLVTFQRIISAVYGYDDQIRLDEKITSAFAPAATSLVELFLSPQNNFSTTALLSLCLTVGRSPPYSMAASHLLNTTLHFFSTVLDVGALLGKPSSYLEQQLFQSLPFFARLYVSNELLKRPVVIMLTALVVRSGNAESEPRSLLGHLGPQTAKDFISSLEQSLLTADSQTWTLFSAVVSCRQQWFATYLLTGDSPKNSLKRKEGTGSSPSNRGPIFSAALDHVASSASLSTPMSISVLTFINAAQSYWPWITNIIRSSDAFLNRILDYLGGLTNDAGRNPSEQAYQLAAAAQVTDILAMYLHNMRQMGDISFIKRLGPKIGYLRAHGVAVPQYNTSLHANLKRNFENKFPGCSLANFKRTTTKSEFGDKYFYDTDFLDLLLGHNQAWMGSKNSFKDEVRRANENLSLVEAHILLMTSWRSLAIELSQSLGQEKTLQKYLASTVHQCLAANAESNLTEAVFQNLIEARVDLALALMQRLIVAKSDVSIMRTLLATTWETTRAWVPDFEVAFTGANTLYYRSLLRLLLLSLQPHTYIQTSDPVTSTGETTPQSSSEWSSDVLPLLLEITTQVVGKGFRSLATQLHEDSSSVQPADFALVIAILQSVLRTPDIAAANSHLTLRLCDTGAHRYAVALFSWSDRLTVASAASGANASTASPPADADPIYADLTLSFLHTLSTIPQMAEFLATEGILSQLSTANILSFFRNPPPKPRQSAANPPLPGYGPLDSPQRFHHIWSRLLLPLVLNVLTAVGPSFAAEAAAFLNTFPLQLQRASACLSAPGAGISLNEASELATLGLITVALERYAADPAVGMDVPELAGWDKAGLREDVEGVLRNGTLDGRVLVLGGRDAELMRAKSPNGATRLVEMIRTELDVCGRCLGISS